MTTPKGHISLSQLQMLMKCGEQYNQRYVKGRKVAPGVSLIRGSCSHKAEEINFKQKIESGLDVTDEAIKDFYSDAWESKRYEIAWSKEDLDGRSIKVAESKHKDEAISVIETFHKVEAPRAIPVAVEQKLEVVFEGIDTTLVAVLDRIDVDDGIVDMKFVGKSPSKDDVVNDLQLTVYDFAYRQVYGKKPQRLEKQFGVNLKIPKAMHLNCGPRDDETLERLIHRIWVAMEALKKGVFLPAAQGSWWCSKNWCGYYFECKLRP